MQPSEALPLQFTTSDLNLASFLRCQNFPILDIRRQGGKTIFVFGDSPELRRAIVSFANDGAVGARSICSTLRDLKALTRQTGNAPVNTG